MSHLKRIKSALINQAYLDPADFKIILNRGEPALVEHLSSGAKISIYPAESIIINGATLRIWASNNGIKELSLEDKEWVSVWSRLKDNNEI